MRNDEMLQIAKEDRNIIYTMKRSKYDWIGHISHWNRLLKHVNERQKK
jgi:hypothetical protein